MGLAAAQTQTDLHRDAATRNVGGDPFMTQYARAFYCNLPDDNNQIVIASRGWNNTTGTGANAQYRIPLTQIFDDVWFIGNHYVGQYLIKTPDGLVQVDAGNNASEVAAFNYPAMQSLGLSASYPLKAVFLTHGHGDHDGGAQWLLDNLGARSYLGSADAGGKSYAPMTINSTNLSLRQMSIGGKNFWVLPTPGHTPGSIEQLEAFARDDDDPHADVWRQYWRRVGKSGRTGIWHETFLVKEGQYEAIYGNMPPHGLGKAGRLVPLSEASRARGRLNTLSV